MDLVAKKLRAGDVKLIMPYFGRRSNMTCDSVVFDSYLWKNYFSLRYAIWEERALFLLLDDGEIFAEVPVCDEETLPEAFAALERFFEEELHRPFLIRWADEESLRILNLDPNRYEIMENPDLADYIYDGEKMRTLSGRKFHKKKNHLNAFLKEYEGRWEYVRLHRWDRNGIWEFLTRWEDDKENVEEHLEAEMDGLHHYLFNMDIFDAVMAGIRIDGKLEAFAIGSYNERDRMSVVHVEKANSKIRGLYTAMSQQLQLHEFPEAVYVNREDDVGIPALRKAKESYNPILMARKYDVRRK